MATYTVTLPDITCAACEQALAALLTPVSEIYSYKTNLANKTLRVETDQSLEWLFAKLEDAGYEPNNPIVENTLFKKALIAGIPALLLLLNHYAAPFLPALTSLGGPLLWSAIASATALLQLWSGWHIYRRAFKQIRMGVLSMDTLVAISSIAAWGFSALIVYGAGSVALLGNQVYFDAGLMVLAFVNVGKYLEEKIRQKASSRTHYLHDILAQEVMRIVLEDLEEPIPAADLRVGDVFILELRQTIPVDCEIISGDASLNQESLTGESSPSVKRRGDTIHAGAIIIDGNITCRVTATGSDTHLATIVSAINNAHLFKPPIGRFADKMVRYFVPAVLLISAFTFAAWIIYGPTPILLNALKSSLSVLTVACPCALGLAIPMAIMAGNNKAYEYGIVFKQPESIETARKVDCFVFDKTGTLTQPSICTIKHLHNYPELLSIALTLESNSEHPYAQTIKQYCQTNQIYPMGMQIDPETESSGSTGRLGADTYAIGKTSFIQRMYISTAVFDAEIAQMIAQGESPVLIAKNNELIGVLGIAHQLKPGARETIDALKAKNIEIWISSGDNEDNVRNIANALQIDNYRSGQSAEQKKALVLELQTQGKTVAKVGDGINDGLALSQANLSVSFSHGADIAQQNAHIVLMNDDLKNIIIFLNISKSTWSKIRQNLAGTLAFNVITIPAAAGALYLYNGFIFNPGLTAPMMAFSSVFVVLNAVRMLYQDYRPAVTADVSAEVVAAPGVAPQTDTNPMLAVGVSTQPQMAQQYPSSVRLSQE